MPGNTTAIGIRLAAADRADDIGGAISYGPVIIRCGVVGRVSHDAAGAVVAGHRAVHLAVGDGATACAVCRHDS